jgi:hypothetical protein
MDFSAYPQWNPFIRSLSAVAKPGEKSKMSPINSMVTMAPFFIRGKILFISLLFQTHKMRAKPIPAQESPQQYKHLRFRQNSPGMDTTATHDGRTFAN